MKLIPWNFRILWDVHQWCVDFWKSTPTFREAGAGATPGRDEGSRFVRPGGRQTRYLGLFDWFFKCFSGCSLFVEWFIYMFIMFHLFWWVVNVCHLYMMFILFLIVYHINILSSFLPQLLGAFRPIPFWAFTEAWHISMLDFGGTPGRLGAGARFPFQITHVFFFHVEFHRMFKAKIQPIVQQNTAFWVLNTLDIPHFWCWKSHPFGTMGRSR